MKTRLIACAVCIVLPYTLSGAQHEEKPYAAVMSLQNRGGLTDNEVSIISDKLNFEISRLDVYNLVERNQIGQILQEQGFQHSGVCSDASCLVEVGQLLAVERMVSGSVGRIGDMISVHLKIIDVRNGAIEYQISRDVSSKTEKLIKKHIREFARELILREEPSTGKPLFARPLFWIPITGIAVGGGTAAYILSSEKTPQETDPFEEVSSSPPARPSVN